MSENKGWIGVDLDGTLAFYDGWKGIEHIGEPVPKMLERVKEWLTEGKKVKIFTARVANLTAAPATVLDCPKCGGKQTFARHNADWTCHVCHHHEVRDSDRQQEKAEFEAHQAAGYIAHWCLKHLGQDLPITATKDFGMIELWDDRCIQVEPNTGRRCDGGDDDCPL